MLTIKLFLTPGKLALFFQSLEQAWELTEIGFDWVCFFAASAHQILRKPLILLILRHFAPLEIGFVFSTSSFLL